MKSEMLYDYYLGIDPGIQTGYALFKRQTKTKLKVPLLCGFTVPASSLPWNKKVEYSSSHVLSLIRPYLNSTIHVTIEQPHHMPGAAGIAAERSDSVTKVAASFGHIWGTLCVYPNVVVRVVEVREWKGQMPKIAVANQLRKKIDPDYIPMITSHAWDAVGLAFYSMGLF